VPFKVSGSNVIGEIENVPGLSDGTCSLTDSSGTYTSTCPLSLPGTPGIGGSTGATPGTPPNLAGTSNAGFYFTSTNNVPCYIYNSATCNPVLPIIGSVTPGDLLTTNATPATGLVDGGAPGANYLSLPNYTELYDDFTSANPSSASTNNTAIATGGIGLTWEFWTGSNGTATFGADTGATGVVTLYSGTTSSAYAQLASGPNASGTVTPVFVLNATTFDFRCRVKLGSTSSINAQCVFADFAGNNTIGIEYNTGASDTGWTCVTESGGTSTRTAITGGTLDATNYHTLRFRSTTAGTVLCSEDGGTEVSVSTNVPSAALGPNLVVQTLTSAAKSAKFDYFGGWIAQSR